jgi:arylsulfatase A-like enzyme
MKMKIKIKVMVQVVMGLALLRPFTLEAQKPNIVYILTDQWRASAFGYAGDPNVQTPNIDQLAKESVNFTNAVTVNPVCTPHRAALQTGRFPTTTGMFLNDLYLPKEELCMAEIFKSEGYNTAYIGKWHLDGHGRLNNVTPERRQGYDYWKALECSHNYNNMPYYDNTSAEIKYWNGYSPFAISKDAQSYIADQALNNNPFLLFVSIATPHFPHASAPQEFKDIYTESEIILPPNIPIEMQERARKELVGYYAHCTATDMAIGELIGEIKKLGIWKNTIVVFTADHGEMMGSQGIRPMAKQVAWDESVTIPFLVKYLQTEQAGSVVNAPLTTPDILPSLLGLSNIKIPPSIEGEDLSDLIKSPNPDTDRAALFMNVCPFTQEHIYEEYRGIRTKQYSYVRTLNGPSMMYDHREDPYQMNNLFEKKEYSKIQKYLDRKLRSALKNIGEEDFKPRQFYLDKWNLSLNDKNKTHVDYISFMDGKGFVQSPKLAEEK